jgi:transcriptional regulator with XRE-family HTH domain
LALGHASSQVATILKIHGTTLTNWERHHTKPSVQFLPRIIVYLGYCPWRPAPSLGERLRQRREALGFSRKRLAKAVSVDEGTLASWEAAQGRLAATSRRRLEDALAWLLSVAILGWPDAQHGRRRSRP